LKDKTHCHIEPLERRQLLSGASVATGPVATELQNAIQFAQTQLTLTETSDLANNPAAYPNSTLPSGAWTSTDATNWSAGAFPSSLWEMYLITGNATWKTQALQWTASLASQDTQTSDLYLRIYDPFIYDYQQTGSAAAEADIITAAQSRLSNFNANVGAWQTTWRASTSGNPLANFGVLLDQTMDAQEVFWAAQQTGNTTWTNDAVDEMATVEKYLVRPNGSTAQWGYFNATTGQFIDQEAFQGFSATSTWSRGQAWAINSFTTAYSYTHRADFLATAENVANYFISSLPSDDIPYWDFNAPGIPNTYRDTSAASIAATGLLQLAKIDPNAANAQKYYLAAQSILASLAAGPYLAKGSTSHGILLQGAGDVPGGDAVDASLNYGDYYFLEAADLYLTQTPTALTIAPAAPTLSPGVTQQFTATVTDQYGRPLTIQPTFAWTAPGGAINSAGLFHAPSTSGTYVISASGDGLKSWDDVTVQTTSTLTINNPGFETPSVGNGYIYDPTGAGWTFAGDAGVAGNNSAFTLGNLPAPQGTQVGFLEQTGSISQTITGWQAGTYILSFSAATRKFYQHGGQNFQVLIDNVVVGTYAPTSLSWLTFTTNLFTVTAGTHTITFKGLDTKGGDNTAFIDNVQVQLASLTNHQVAAVGVQTPPLD
jgi:hypothetical protein